MQKRNYAEKKYYPYQIPEDWNCKWYSQDMEEEINCASCGKVFPYWKSYTSRQIHSSMGFGYGVL